MIKQQLFTRISLILILGFWCLSVFSQSNKPTIPKPPLVSAPGNIQLPDGYIYERRSGKDSHVGEIVRKDGFTIAHDIGRMAGNRAGKYFPEYFDKLRKQTHLNPQAIERQIQPLESKIEWRQRQKVNGDDLMLVFLKDSTIIASFANSNANFIAKTDSTDKIADFLLIVLTYKPDFDKRK